MFTRETVRLICFLSVLYGVFLLRSRPEDGGLATTYRLCLVVGGAIGLLVLHFGFRKQEGPEQQSKVSLLSPQIDQLQPVRPDWMGDPQGNRRRLMIVLVIFVMLAIAITIYFMTL